MNPVIDAHQHFWTYGTYQTSWMEVPPYAGDPAFQPLRRSFAPHDLAPELQAAGVRYTVAIEAARGVGPERLMRGSDWPVANPRGGYSKVWRETTRALAGLSREECDRILGGTAIAFYRLPGLC
jgi:predicted TIM-barrel fold metal-dependent hydrolase